MPEVSRFFGIVISMNFGDHPPPHFHVRYGGQKAMFGIDDLRLLEGRLAPRVHGLVAEWAAAHQVELAANWERVSRNQTPNKINPLE